MESETLFPHSTGIRCVAFVLHRHQQRGGLGGVASGRSIHTNKPITGQAAFLHESGIHCSALLKDRKAYELFSAGEVGRPQPDFVIGKHSGSEAVVNALAQQGIVVSRKEASEMLPEIRRRCVRVKSPLQVADLADFFKKSRRQV
jgi:homocitrate synthase NifV